ncbi:MAG: rod shape-determining protein RodA [Candidatus Nealsonbacteria bacterium]|nr:rod shape-determining protein RodA [Candidatus Nealsonbacteria bacterium]
MFNYLKKLDWILIISVLLLVSIGLLSIYSSSIGRDDFFNFKKQLVFFGIGFSLMLFLSFFDWRIFRENPYLILGLYFICIILLVGLFFFGPVIKGARGWYKIGPFSFDPIEFTKIILLILLAKYFSMRHIEMYRLSHIILSGFYIFFPAVLIFYQPDLGPVLILISVWLGVLIVSGIKLRHFLILVLCGLVVLTLSWSFLLRDYQKARLISFFEPQLEPLGMSWSQNQSKIAIGAGGIFGQGFARGSQTQYGFLPEVQTDFIFSAIAEEFGLMGILILFSLFMVLVWRIMKIAISAQSNFPRLFAFGFAIILVIQAFIHIGMNLGILPVIGLPLPLISYGGSGLIATFIGLGILQSCRGNS